MAYGNRHEAARKYYNSQTGSEHRAYSDAAAEYFSKLLSGEIDPGGGGTPDDGSVTTAKLADGAVTAPKLDDGSVVTAKLANTSVTNAKIAAGIAATKTDVEAYADGGVTAGDLQATINALADRITALEP